MKIRTSWCTFYSCAIWKSGGIHFLVGSYIISRVQIRYYGNQRKYIIFAPEDKSILWRTSWWTFWYETYKLDATWSYPNPTFNFEMYHSFSLFPQTCKSVCSPYKRESDWLRKGVSDLSLININQSDPSFLSFGQI